LKLGQNAETPGNSGRVSGIGKNSTVVFDLVEKAFNQMTSFINKPITGSTLAATRRNGRLKGLVL
jgi:hypothetical protein